VRYFLVITTFFIYSSLPIAWAANAPSQTPTLTASPSDKDTPQEKDKDKAAAIASSVNNYMSLTKSIVSVVTTTSVAAYYPTGKFYGTGAILDMAKGWIVTNSHVASVPSISSLEIRFFNGDKITTEKVIYAHATHDFAIIQVDPSQIPAECAALSFEAEVKNGETIKVIGNSVGEDYSVFSGFVSQIYTASGPFHSESLRMNIIARGGISGSPVLNEKGNAVGLSYGTDQDSTAWAVPSKYIIDAYNSLKNGSKPIHATAGFICKYTAISDLQKFSKFPKKQGALYKSKFSDARGEALVVLKVMEGFSAHGKLQPGDMLWKVNGELLGPNLFILEKAFNTATKPVKLTIYRNGKEIDLEITAKSLPDRRLNRYITFAGATFYESDYYMHVYTGVPLGSVLVSVIESGKTFSHIVPTTPVPSHVYQIAHSNILSMSSFSLQSLDDLKKALPALLKEKNFTMVTRNYGFQFVYNGVPYLSRDEQQKDVELALTDTNAQYYEWNEEKGTWAQTEITAAS